MNKRKLKANAPWVAAILGLAFVAAVTSLYILRHQRLRLPIDDIYTVQAELPTGQALTPGQGQSVTVAGVRVGEISKVQLRNGRALVDMAIERDKLPGRIHSDATMLVRPRTPLQDMTIDVDPGSERAPELGDGVVLGVDRTTPSTNLDEVLAVLDTDTRTWATTLLKGLGSGVGDRGKDLRAVWKASAPTLRATRQVAAATAARRRELRRAVTSLSTLTKAVAAQDRSLGRLVDAGDATFSTLAAEQTALREGLTKLPPTLAAAQDALEQTRPFSRAAAPALTRLIPTAEQLPQTLRELDPLVREGTPAIAELRGLAREGRPLARALRGAAGDLSAVTPALDETFVGLRHLTNLLAYNPPGKEEGFLFWMSWFLHNGHQFISGQDANGPFWRGSVIISCSSALNLAPLTDLLSLIVGPLNVCPKIPGGTPAQTASRTSGGRGR